MAVEGLTKFYRGFASNFVRPGAKSPVARRVYTGNIYTQRALRDTGPHFREMPDLGPLVWMPRHKMWAVSRFDDVRAALRARDVLINGRGVSANRVANGLNAHRRGRGGASASPNPSRRPCSLRR